MVVSVRMFFCAFCHRQVFIGSCCDRGHIYCRAHGAREARLRSWQRSGEAYQRTEAGRIYHAARQQAYLIRKAEKEEKMTQQGSHKGALLVSPDLAVATTNQPAADKEGSDASVSFPQTSFSSAGLAEATRTPEGSGGVCCDFCGRLGDRFVRLDPRGFSRVRHKGRRVPRLPVFAGASP